MNISSEVMNRLGLIPNSQWIDSVSETKRLNVDDQCQGDSRTG